MQADSVENKNSQGDSRTKILLLIISGIILYFFVNVQRAGIPGPIFDQLQQYYHLDPDQVTALGASFMYTYAALQILGGILVGRFGWLKTMRWGSIVFAAGSLLFPLAPISTAPWLLYAARILMALGCGSFYLCGVQAVSIFFPKKLSLSLGIFLTIGFLGNVVVNAPMVYAVRLTGYKAVFLGIGEVIVLAVFIFNLASIGVKQTGATAKKISMQFLLGALCRKNNIYIYICGIFNYGLFFTLQTVIGKKYAQDYCGMTENGAAMLFTAVAVCASFSNMITAVIATYLKEKRYLFYRYTILLSLFVFSVNLLCLLCNVRSFWPLALLLLFALTSSTAPITIPIFKNTNPPEELSLATGLSNTGCYVAVAVFGNLCGWVLKHSDSTVLADRIVYGRQAWIIIFSLITLIIIPGLYCAFKVKSQPDAGAEKN